MRQHAGKFALLLAAQLAAGSASAAAPDGKALFKDTNQFNLKLVSSQGFKSGNVLLNYETAR